MGTYLGQEHSYSNTVNQKVMITDRIIMADPYDITAIVALGLDNESKFQFVNQPNRTYYWLEDAYPTVVTTAADSTDLTDVTATVTIGVTDSDLFGVGDVVKIDTEYVWVSAIASSNVLTVVREFGASTGATHATNATMTIVYSARLEGATSSDTPWTEVSSQSNYSTILHREVDITRDDKLFPRYGMSDLKSYKIDRNMDVLMQQLNNIPYYGQFDAGSATAARSAGGFPTFITTNATALSSATLLRSHIDTEFQQIFSAGGKTDLILCGPWFQRKVNDFYEGFVETTRDEGIGGMLIKQLMHPITGALVKVVVDRHCPADSAFLIDTRYAGYITIDPFFYEELAKTGDFEHGQTIGEYGFVVAYNKAHSILSGFSTTA
jgi:hypothetical protein